jgi:hydrogenase expression/formation protein HypC
MCIGIPMQVIGTEPGHAMCSGRGELRRVRTALVGDVDPGEWLLVFIDSAQERIDVRRAAEVDATLDLLAAAMSGAEDTFPHTAPAAFDLPSRLRREDLLALAGAPAEPTP